MLCAAVRHKRRPESQIGHPPPPKVLGPREGWLRSFGCHRPAARIDPGSRAPLAAAAAFAGLSRVDWRARASPDVTRPRAPARERRATPRRDRAPRRAPSCGRCPAADVEASPTAPARRSSRPAGAQAGAAPRSQDDLRAPWLRRASRAVSHAVRARPGARRTDRAARTRRRRAPGRMRRIDASHRRPRLRASPHSDRTRSDRSMRRSPLPPHAPREPAHDRGIPPRAVAGRAAAPVAIQADDPWARSMTGPDRGPST